MDIKNTSKNSTKKIKVFIGFGITSKVYGRGKCTKIDYTSKDFRYFFEFEDGTVKWMSDKDVTDVLAGKESVAVTV